MTKILALIIWPANNKFEIIDLEMIPMNAESNYRDFISSILYSE